MLVNRRDFLLLSSLVTFHRVPFANAQPRYPETILGLQRAYLSEIQAHLNYLAYAEKAKSENYVNMTYFFSSLAASEAIHARNFKQVLFDLGAEVKDSPRPEVKVSGTQGNLKAALDFELEDIERRYPELLEKIKAEKNETAIRNVCYAWESEKQHRDLILKMQSGTGIFFGMLAKRIETTSVRSFVCQVCGSTLFKLPEDACPICNSPPSSYKELEKPK
jgi:rubrerythrin